MVGMRVLAPYPSVEVHGYHFLPGIIRNVNIFNFDINHWLQSRKGLGYFLLSVVSHFLTDYLQRLGGNAENEPSSIGIKECTCCVHAILKLACRFLQLQRA